MLVNAVQLLLYGKKKTTTTTTTTAVLGSRDFPVHTAVLWNSLPAAGRITSPLTVATSARQLMPVRILLAFLHTRFPIDKHNLIHPANVPTLTVNPNLTLNPRPN